MTWTSICGAPTGTHMGPTTALHSGRTFRHTRALPRQDMHHEASFRDIAITYERHLDRLTAFGRRVEYSFFATLPVRSASFRCCSDLQGIVRTRTVVLHIKSGEGKLDGMAS